MEGSGGDLGGTWVKGIQTDAVGSEEAAAAVGGSGSGTSNGEREVGVKGVLMGVLVVGAGLMFVV